MQSSHFHVSTQWAARRDELRGRILSVDPAGFDLLALDVFQYQAALNPTYQAYLEARRIDPASIQSLLAIPFMPIGFFKQHAIVSASQPVAGLIDEAICFASSGTTGDTTSRHYLFDTGLYEAVSRRIFEETYGPLTDFHILALLPSYLERNNSSLVYMVQQFVAETGSADSGFYLNNTAELTEQIRQLLTTSSRRILLIGVTFALLDWVETTPDLQFIGESGRVVVMETGGMKGRRREMIREEVHAILTDRLGIPAIHSEYGMTELLSQGYSTGEGLFQPGATMRVLLRDVNDPLTITPPQPLPNREGLKNSQVKAPPYWGGVGEGFRTGGINVVDLANLDSCSFIETNDLGQYGPQPESFRVMGRFDNSDVRGCNLMVV